MTRFPYTYFNPDPDALGDKQAAQEQAERMADQRKDERKERELDQLKMNTLLIGKAEVLSEIREDIQRMVDNPGIWIVTDENQPGAEIPVVSMDGKLYAIELSTELAPERFLPTARVAGGPYRANEKDQP